MRVSGRKRGSASKKIELLTKLSPLLRSAIDPERMLRSVASLLAVEIGQYCIVDFMDRSQQLRRIDIVHADQSRNARLRVLCEDTRFAAGGRLVRLLAKGGSEIASKVDGARARAVSDIVLLAGESPRSYMATTVNVGGVPIAVLTMVVTNGTRRYGTDELVMLETAAQWIGLGVENAQRRERESIVPPRYSGYPSRATEPPASGRAKSRA